MEANVKNDMSDRAPQFKDFTFEKFTYHYPATYFKAPLSDRSVKVKKEKKEQPTKEDDKDSHHHHHHHKKHPHHSSRASNLHSSRTSRAELHGPPADAHRLQAPPQDDNPLNSKASINFLSPPKPAVHNHFHIHMDGGDKHNLA
jgi:hypothetical protein